jgi:DNA segregation ATPase FtsK/SpoIIIE-like protein
VKIKSIRQIVPEVARCIEVDSPDRLFAAGGPDGVSFVSHNSVVQRSIILGTILRPDSWRFLGIDLKKVELSGFRAYSNVVLGIATTLEDALTVLRFAQQTMMKRYAELEQLGLNNFLDLPEKGQALMVMVDEAGELLSASGVKSEEGKAEDELKGEAQMIIGSIARLGRAAGVHLVIATQRPDATLLPGETKANLGVRINCGRTDSNASSMILGTGDGVRVKANPRGRLYLRIYGAGDHGQGFFAQPDWIDNYLASKGLNPDGTPISGRRTRLANVADMSQFEDADLDAREGIDNSAVINKIREEESSEDFEKLIESFENDSPSPQVPDFDDDEDDDDEDEEENFEYSAVEEDTNKPGSLGRPELSKGTTDMNKFRRPEEDWDSELEALIRENNT